MDGGYFSWKKLGALPEGEKVKRINPIFEPSHFGSRRWQMSTDC